jgi:hypothetical protein
MVAAVVGMVLGMLLERAAQKIRPCRPDIFEEGEHVCTIAGVPARVIEAHVRAAADLTGEPVDWHYIGGRAVVRALGDTAKVASWFRDHRMIYGDASPGR